ncbi:hypothetical protein BDW67DRAFT_185255 [Aspergillus spinulosporus]
MPDIANLPAKLLNGILHFTFGLAPRHDNRCEGTLDIKGLSRLLPINQKHHQVLLLRVYSSWNYNRALHSYSGLWKFLCTVAQNPVLALIVRVLNFGNLGVCPLFYLDRNHELQDQDEQLQFGLNNKETAETVIRPASSKLSLYGPPV